jgi:hypothetical protein
MMMLFGGVAPRRAAISLTNFHSSGAASSEITFPRTEVDARLDTENPALIMVKAPKSAPKPIRIKGVRNQRGQHRNMFSHFNSPVQNPKSL